MSHYECKKCHNRYDDCNCSNSGVIKRGDYVVRHKSHQDKFWVELCEKFNKKPDDAFKVLSVGLGNSLVIEDFGPREWYIPYFYKVHIVPTKSDMSDSNMVTKPKHYEFFDGVEAITIIARSMTEKQFAGYCMGNALKYRLRAGKKFNTEEDLKKADYYKELFQKHRHECIDEDI